MNDMALWFGLLGAEIVLVVLLLLVVAWVRNRAAALRDRKAMASLIKHAREAKSQREQVIADYLAGLGLQGELLQASKTRILNEELRLLQRFADIYGKRDAASAAQFFIHAEAALAPYHELAGQGAVEAVPVEAGEGDAAELEKLRKENARLSEELSVSMDTMSRMLSEYSTMFSTADSADDSLPLEGQGGGTLLEAGGGLETEADSTSIGEGREQPALESNELDIGDEPGNAAEVLAGEPMEIDMPDEPTAELDEATLQAELAGELGEGVGGDALLTETSLELDETMAMAPPDTAASGESGGEQQDIGEHAVAEEVADRPDDTGELDLGVEDLDALFDDDESTEAPPKHGANTISI